MNAPARDIFATPSRSRRRGYTLMEIVISIAIVTVIMGAMVSTMLIARRGMQISAVGTESVSAASGVVQQMTAELSLATSITEQTASALTFTVPDRNDDGQDETIRYSWSGTAGDPLTRQYNGGSVATIAQDVHYFNMDYLARTIGPP